MRLNEKIEIVPYNPEWERQYIDEINLLKQNSYLMTLVYEHIGSTAIPYIKAKPIIDIIAGVKNFPPQKEVIKALEKNGYTYMEEMSVIDRLYFIKRGLKNFNIHIIEYKGNIWNKDVLFRDYLT